MTPERWQQVEEVFQAALDLPEGERAAFIERACAGDEDLRSQVAALVAQHDEAGDFIEAPALALSGIRPEADAYTVAAPTSGVFADPAIGRRIGAYRVVREIGRGGMGAVYLAERADSEFRRSVAIKLVKRGMDTDFILKRFRNERQILATLSHPNIARLLDGGTTEDGLPYFVMDYIEGQPVYRFCDERRLSVAERLQLFQRICEAVHYAHRNLVIHRDIKPSNVLVVRDGTPKLLDFGIAKVLNPDIATDITLDPTATAMRLMTPEYASPEQVQGQPVTPATDVYSLGVLLYELLTGHRPYRLRNRAPHDIARVICEDEPPGPSLVVTRAQDLLPAHPHGKEALTPEQVYENRSTTPEALRQELSGDLDNIVMKALRKEPERRYSSAEQLSEDITRHLEGRPVAATAFFAAYPRPAPAPYVPEAQAGEESVAILPFKLLVSSTASGATGQDYLSLGLADALITRLGTVRRLVVRPTSGVLRYQGGEADPLVAGRELNVSYVVEGMIQLVGERIRVTARLLSVRENATRWANKFDEKFTDVLSLEDSISEQVARALIPHLTGEEQRRLSKRGTDDPEAYEHFLRGRYHLNTFTEEGFARAMAAYTQAVALDPAYALAYAGIAEYHLWLGVYGVLRGPDTFGKAQEYARRAIELDDSLAEAYATLGHSTLLGNFDWESAEADCRRALEINPNSVAGHVWYSCQMMMEGRHEESVPLARRAVELDPVTPFNQYFLGWVLYYARRFDESVEQFRRTIAANPLYPLGHFGLAWVLRYLGRHAEALSAARRAQELSNDSLFMLLSEGQAFAAAGRRGEAAEVLAKAEELSAGQYVSQYQVALIHAYLGDDAQTLSALERASEDGESWLGLVGVEPALARLRSEPRFGRVFERTRNPLRLRRAGAQRQTGEPPTGEKSVAVLPLKVLHASGAEGTGDEYLGVGLADALITRLTSVQRFVVRPTNSVLRYQGGDADPLAAGRELGVDYVVSGNIRRAGERIRVTAQLLSVGEGATRWAARFDEKSADVLSLEDSISAQVAEALIPRLSGDERRQLSKRGTDDPEAYEAYIRGRYHWNTFTEESFARAFEYYNRAIRLDPSYAAAHAALADYHNFVGIFCVVPFAEASRAAAESARRAVALDDTLPEAHAALGLASLSFDWDWPASERHYQRAVALNPNHAGAHNWYGFFLAMSGRFDESLAETRRAQELDPLSSLIVQSLGWGFYHARRFDESLTAYRNLLNARPDSPWGNVTYSLALSQAGQREEAVASARKAVELTGGASPFYLQFLGAALAAAGREAEAREVLGRVYALARERYVSSYFLAYIHLRLGERHRALSLLEEAYEQQDGWLVWLGVDPEFEPLRGEQRFQELLRRTRNPAASKEADAAEATPSTTSSQPPAQPAASAATPATPRRPTEDEEAHKLYVAGRYFSTRRTAEGLRQAIQRFEQAVGRDPKFALAWAEMADCYALLNWYGEPPPADAWPRARQAALRAVEADDLLAEAHASLGFVMSHYERDHEGAERELRRAVELKPDNPVARRWHAFNLSAMGRHDEAVAEIKRAQELSPRSPVMASAVANVLFFAQRFDEAVGQCQKALEIDPGSTSTHIVLRWCYEMKGMCAEALAVFDEERAFAGDTPMTRLKRAHVLASCGRTDEARPILEELAGRRAQEWVTAFEIAVVYSLLGERDAAFRWLARAEAEKAVGLTYLRVDPRLKHLRDDPRFRQLLDHVQPS